MNLIDISKSSSLDLYKLQVFAKHNILISQTSENAAHKP
jgi:hypothetical protein